MSHKKFISQQNKLSLMNLEQARSIVNQWVPKIKILKAPIKDMDGPEEILNFTSDKNCHAPFQFTLCDGTET